MNAVDILRIYIAFFVLHLLVDWLLEYLNFSSAKARFSKVPEFFSDWISLDKYQSSLRYTWAKQKLGLLSGLASSLFLLVFIFLSWFGELDSYLREQISSDYFRGLVYIFLLSGIFSLVSLPFSLYRQFVIEERFGFNRMTLGLWLSDLIKSILISVILLSPLLLALFWFIDSLGSWWWFWAWALMLVFQLLMVIIFPTLIAPLFNKFEPISRWTAKRVNCSIS